MATPTIFYSKPSRSNKVILAKSHPAENLHSHLAKAQLNLIRTSAERDSGSNFARLSDGLQDIDLNPVKSATMHWCLPFFLRQRPRLSQLVHLHHAILVLLPVVSMLVDITTCAHVFGLRPALFFAKDARYFSSLCLLFNAILFSFFGARTIFYKRNTFRKQTDTGECYSPTMERGMRAPYLAAI